MLQCAGQVPGLMSDATADGTEKDDTTNPPSVKTQRSIIMDTDEIAPKKELRCYKGFVDVEYRSGQAREGRDGRPKPTW